jgi:nicotinate-nucleotide adenylyltransferase
VLLMPVHTAPNKARAEAGARTDASAGWSGRDPGPEHRLRMCQLAAEGAAGVSVCAAEIERGGVSYTVDTLDSLHASHPDAELTLIVGADVAATIGSWRQPERLTQLAGVAVAARPGAAPAAAAIAGAASAGAVPDARPLAPAGARITRIEMPAIDVSSSLVRDRVARGEPIEELVGPAVAEYIAEHGLYRPSQETSA